MPNATNGLVQHYVITYTSAHSSLSVYTAPSNLSASITDLYPDTLYSVEIVAVNGAGSGKPTGTTITTRVIGTIIVT